MEAQLTLVLDNVEAVIRKGNYDWTNIVRLTVYTLTSYQKIGPSKLEKIDF